MSTGQGDAVAWLADRGAGFRNMGACLRSGLVVVGHGTRVSPSLPFLGAVLLDLEGRRFRRLSGDGLRSAFGMGWIIGNRLGGAG